MKKQMHRLLAMVLSLILVIGLIPGTMTAYAASDITTGNATVTAPVAGETPNFTAVSAEPDKYSVEVVEWNDKETGTILSATDTFVGGKEYNVLVVFSPVGENTLSYNNTFTINGNKTWWQSNGLKRGYTFTATGTGGGGSTDVYSATMSDVTFDSVEEGYTDTTIMGGIKIENTGNKPLTQPKVELVSGDVDAFVIGSTAVPADIAAGAIDEHYFVRYVAGLTEGTYEATIQFTATELGTPVTATVKLVVTESTVVPEPDPVYSATMSDVTFDSVEEGYTNTTIMGGIKIENTGNKPLTQPDVKLVGGDVDAFVIGATAVPADIAAGAIDEHYFVRYVAGLTEGTYEATIQFTATELGTPVTATVKLVVTESTVVPEPDPVYSATMSDVTFDSVEEGYTNTTIMGGIKIENTGNKPLTQPDVKLVGGDVDAFVIGATAVPADIAAGKVDEHYFVRYVAGLAKGTYEATIQFTATELEAPITATVKLVVTESTVVPEPDPVYSATMSDVTFASVEEGYTNTTIMGGIKIENTGNKPLTQPDVKLVGGDVDAFVIGATAVPQDIGAGKIDEHYFVRYVAGLAAGTYEATIQFTATELEAPVTATVKLVVTGASGELDDIPQTGDPMDLVLWGSLAMISAMAAAALIILQKKRVY